MEENIPAITVFQHCMMTISPKSFSKDKKVELDFGKDANLVKNYGSTVFQEAIKVGECTTIIDALNYMSGLGWEIVHLTPFTTNLDGGTYEIFRYLLRRAVK